MRKHKPGKQTGKKAQVDIALLLGSVIVPAGALIGALIFAFAMVSSHADAAKLAAVISYDIASLTDIAYSVPENMVLRYSPPSLCRFVDRENPNPCKSSPVPCLNLDTPSDCHLITGCSWDTSVSPAVCVGNCSALDMTDCDDITGCEWDSILTPPACVGNIDSGVYDECISINDETECNARRHLGCDWTGSRINMLYCMQGYMNITSFRVSPEFRIVTILDETTAFPFYLYSHMNTIIKGETENFQISYPSFANPMDVESTPQFIINTRTNTLELSKRRVGEYDSLATLSGDNKDFLQLTVITINDACKTETNQAYNIKIPKFYTLSNISTDSICIERFSQSPHYVTSGEIEVYVWSDGHRVPFHDLNITTVISCFDLSKISDCNISLDPSFSTNFSYSQSQNYQVSAEVEVVCDPTDPDDCETNVIVSVEEIT